MTTVLLYFKSAGLKRIRNCRKSLTYITLLLSILSFKKLVVYICVTDIAFSRKTLLLLFLSFHRYRLYDGKLTIPSLDLAEY